MTQPPDTFIQAAGAGKARLVRLTAHVADNRYSACRLELDADGELVESQDTVEVLNLAEAEIPGGRLEDDFDAIAIDLEGRWVIAVQPAMELLAARVVANNSGAWYRVQPQTVTAAGTFADDTAAEELLAQNLAERTLGTGGGVDDDEIVLVKPLDASTATTLATSWAFEYPVYAKYMVDAE